MPTSVANFYVTGGTLAPDAPSYAERRADRDLLAGLEQGETCYVLNSRQMGKSSLCVRTILRLKQAGVRSAFCDLTKFGGRNLTAEQWYAALLSEVGRELGLRTEFLDHWKEHLNLPPVQRLFGAITELAPANGPVVIFIDEIDVTLSLPFSADEFFAAIRQCFVGRATDEKLKQLSFCLLGTATPADLIKDTRVSPFNIGKRIELQDFTQSEAKPLAAGLQTGGGVSRKNAKTQIEDTTMVGQTLLDRVLYWTGGHPYLTQRLCRAVADAISIPNTQYPIPELVDRICSDLFLTHRAKESDDNLAFVRNRLLKSEADLAALLDLYRQMQSGKPMQDDETNPLCAILKLSGVAKVDDGQLKVRNRIYQHVFDSAWVEDRMPDAEKRRQREAYRKGVLRAAVLASLVLSAMGLLLARSNRATRRARDSANRATAETLRANRILYAADMQLCQKAWDDNNQARLESLLNETVTSPDRGWEWGYWSRLRHLYLRSFDGKFAFYSNSLDRIVTVAYDGVIHLYHQAGRGEATRISTNAKSVSAAAISDDGRRLAMGTLNGDIQLWDLKSGTILKTIAGNGQDRYSLAFSPDGSLLSSIGRGGSWILNLQQAKPDLKIDVRAFTGTMFSPDSRRLIASCGSSGVVICDARTGRQLRKLNVGRTDFFGAVWLKDGRRVVTGNGEGAAGIWDTNTGKLLVPLQGSPYWMDCIAVSPDEKQIATGGSDQAIRIWDSRTGALLTTCKGQTGHVTALTYCPDGRRLLVSTNTSISEWDASRIHDFDAFKTLGPIYKVRFSNDGHSILYVDLDNSLVRLLDPATGRIVRSAATKSRYFGDITADNRALIIVGSSNSLVGVDIRTGAVRPLPLPAFVTNAFQACVSPDCRFCADYGKGYTIHIVDLLKSREVSVLRGDTKDDKVTCFSRDGRTVVTRSLRGNTLKLWDTQTGKNLASYPVTEHFFRAAVSNDRAFVAVCVGRQVKELAAVLDAQTGKTLSVIAGHSDTITSIAFSSYGDRLLTSSTDRTARLWNPKTGLELLAIRHTAAVDAASFSPDDCQIVTACEDNMIRVYTADRVVH